MKIQFFLLNLVIFAPKRRPQKRDEKKIETPNDSFQDEPADEEDKTKL